MLHLINKPIIIFLAILFLYKDCYAQDWHKTDWFKNQKYGILIHYINRFQNAKMPQNEGKVTSWDSCIMGFNVKKFAKDVAETGAGYVIFTTQQNDQFFSCPNDTFEKLSGYKRGTATPRRDLINEIYLALKARGIKLMLYVTGNGPYKDQSIKKVFNDSSMKTLITPWSKVLKDISLRYKSKIKGW